MNPAVTVLTISKEELSQIISNAVQHGFELATRHQGERIGIEGLAARYDVSRRTISNWMKEPGKLPSRRAGNQWLLSDIMEWERDRGNSSSVPILYQ